MNRAADALCVLVGAGPSLDYARSEILSLIGQGARFLVSDSVAAAFVKLYPAADVTIFTVELRRHPYLSRIGKNGISPLAVMAYAKAHARNLRLPARAVLTRFKLAGEPGDMPELYSPGTVLGVMLSYAVTQMSPPGEILILGADFCYIDQQIYSRFVLPHAPPTNRLNTHENWQLVATFKKTGGVLMKNGFAIRTAFELMQARENMRALIEKLPASVSVAEYSPVGFESPRVAKRVPASR